MSLARDLREIEHKPVEGLTPQQLGERSGVGAWQWLGNLLEYT
jgi:hypothetical protein